MAATIARNVLHSVRGRLGMLVLAIAIPAVVLVALVTKRGYDNERTSAGNHLAGTARAVAALVERKFDAGEAMLRGLEKVPALTADDLPAFEAVVRSTVHTPDQWVVLMRPDGQQLMNTLLPPEMAPPAVTVEDEFWRDLRDGQRHVSNVIAGPAARGAVLTVSIPIMRDNELKYALTLAMFPSALAKSAAMQEVVRTGVVVILDRNGTVAARSRAAETFVGRKATAPFLAAVAEQEEGIFEGVSLDGVPTLSAFTHCSKIGWVAAVGAPKAELYASARHLLWVAAAWSGVLVGVATLVALWVGRAMVRGMEALVADTVRIGAGEPPSPHPSGLIEVDVVADALRQTAQRLFIRERELRQFAETLEQRVADRTRELDQANVQLKAANRELEEFGRVASHDLREPLRSIAAFAEILREDYTHLLDDTGRKYLERITASTDRLAALLQAILEYSKVSTAPMAPFETVDLNRAVAEVEQDVSQRLADTKGQIKVGHLGSVHGDRRQLHQLLMNLIGNALKFHRPGVPPVVQIEARQDNGYVHVSVVDNGVGFDSADAERIFVPFERLDRAVDGSGIGLAIVRRIAERHGGTVRAHSRRGVGSRFDVVLPSQAAVA